MRGAEALQRTLVAAGVDVCFMNPGTSEMHFVAALDQVPEMRGVLTLFEGVATGASDGYGRMKGSPAAALVHLGPGLANGIANLHNARRARTPLVVIVGDHATTHKGYDSLLDSDIDALASNPSQWIRRSGAVADIGADAADAVAAATGPPAGVATLILPADVSWSEGAAIADAPTTSSSQEVTSGRIEETAALLRNGEATALLLGGPLLADADALRAAQALAHATGARVFMETFPARLARGRGVPAIDRLAYRAQGARTQLDGVRQLLLVGASHPYASFAYPDQHGDLVPTGCTVHPVAAPVEDGTRALLSLADFLAPALPALPDGGSVLAAPTGPLTRDSLAQAIAACLPEQAIVSDEGQTLGVRIQPRTAEAAPHDWLCLTGGAIGQGLPVAVGAAVACPGRPVLALQADGSSLYTIQALWTMAREGLDVTVVLLSNGTYGILEQELELVGAGYDGGGPRSKAMLDISGPRVDFVEVARGLGVAADHAADADEVHAALTRALAEPGPHLVEVRL